jgi:hypothetical protein
MTCKDCIFFNRSKNYNYGSCREVCKENPKEDYIVEFGSIQYGEMRVLENFGCIHFNKKQ